MAKKFYCDERTIVDTKQGKLQGFFTDGLYIFKGVQYAKAERFCAPQEPDQINGVFDATSYGYVCPLLSLGKPSGELNVPHRYWVQNEDCLNLNVWTKGLDDKKRPVVVWLHGGGFEAGSAIEHDAYDMANITNLGDVVSVSINHRLNILGYLDLSPLSDKYTSSANNGSLDMVYALKWIKDNIAAFGGDPDNVTLFGQSGGGAKVTTLLQMPAADGLFHKGMVMSGVYNLDLLGKTDDDPNPFIDAFLAELNLTRDNYQAIEILPYETLAAAYNKVSPIIRMQKHYVGGSPKANADYVGEPSIVGFRKESQNVPLIVSSVFGEFAFGETGYDKRKLTKEQGEEIIRQTYGEAVEPILPLFEKAYPDRNPIDLMVLDFVFRGPETPYIALRSTTSPVYSSMFDLDFNLGTGKAAWHCADIPYIFHNTHMVDAVNLEDVTDKLEEQMFQSFMAFARTGDPNNELIPRWERSVPNEENTMIWGRNVRVEKNFDHELLQKFTPIAVPVLMQMMQKLFGNIQH